MCENQPPVASRKSSWITACEKGWMMRLFRNVENSTRLMRMNTSTAGCVRKYRGRVENERNPWLNTQMASVAWWTYRYQRWPGRHQMMAAEKNAMAATLT